MSNETPADPYLAAHPDATPRLNAALKSAQAEMGPTRKDKKNPHFKSTYASLSAVIDNIREPLTDNGLSWSFDVAGDGASVSVRTIFRHVSGEEIRSDWLKMPVVQATPQGLGSSITYAKRYSLEGFAGLGSADDDGNAGSGRAESQPSAKEQAERAEGIKKLVDAFGAMGVSRAVLEAQLKHPVESITNDEWTALRAQYKAEKAKQDAPQPPPDEAEKAEKGIRAELDARFAKYIDRIKAAKSAAEIALVQSDAVASKLPKAEMAALTRSAKDYTNLLAQPKTEAPTEPDGLF